MPAYGVEIDVAATLDAAGRLQDSAARLRGLVDRLTAIGDPGFLDTGKDDGTQARTWFVPQAENCKQVADACSRNAQAIGDGAQGYARSVQQLDTDGAARLRALSPGAT